MQSASLRLQSEPNEERDSFFRRLKNSLIEHKKHVIIWLIAIIVGISIGIALNYSFNLGKPNLIVRRTFKQNQALQYGRVLTACIEVGSNTTLNVSVGNSSNRECNVEKTVVTFYVANKTEAGFSLITKVEDYQTFTMNSEAVQASNFSNLSYTDFPENYSNPIPYIFFLQLDPDGQFVSLSADRAVSKTTIELVKSILIQFTPKLNKNLFENKESTHTYFGRLLSMKDHKGKERPFEEHPQGYVQPIRRLLVDNENSVSIDKSYTNQDFMPGSGFDNSRAKLNYSEQTILDKKQGLLNSSVVSQEYYYNRDPKNDLLNVDYKMQSSSNFKLGYQFFFDGDASEKVFGEKIVFPSTIRALSKLQTERTLFEVNPRDSLSEEKAIHKFADNLERERVLVGLDIEKRPRILENAPQREMLGQPYKVILTESPKALFDYGFSFFVDVSLYKDYYLDFANLDDSTSLNLYKSFIGIEYALKLSIIKDGASVRDINIYSGAAKVNTTLLDMIPRIEAFETEFFGLLKKLDEKIKGFTASCKKFLGEIKLSKKSLFEYSYSLVFVTLKIEANIIFDFNFELTTNIMELYDNAKLGLQNYYQELRDYFTTSITQFIPQTTQLSSIEIDPAIMDEIQNFVCEKGKKYWLVGAFYKCKNKDNSITDFTPAQYETKKAFLDNALQKYQSSISAAKNKFLSEMASFHNRFANVRERIQEFLKFDLQFGYESSGSVKLEALIKIDTSIMNIGVSAIGDLLSFDSTAGIKLDLWAIANDFSNAGKYIRIYFTFGISAFTFTFNIFYEVVDCDYFNKFNEKLSIFGFTRRLSNEDRWRLIEAVKFNRPSVGLPIVERAITGVSNGRLLEMNYSNMASELWDFFLTAKNNVNLACSLLPGERKRLNFPLYSVSVTSVGWTFEKNEVKVSDLLGKAEKAKTI